MRSPSGDHTGSASVADLSVIRIGLEPSELTTQTSVLPSRSELKAINPLGSEPLAVVVDGESAAVGNEVDAVAAGSEPVPEQAAKPKTKTITPKTGLVTTANTLRQATSTTAHIERSNHAR